MKKNIFENMPYSEVVMKEMCSRVGTTLDKVNFNNDKWFTKHSWTEEEQDSFKNWLTDYLYKSPGARREIMSYPVKNKKIIRSCSGMFILNYGWKLK